jgi:dihydrofolate reductase
MRKVVLALAVSVDGYIEGPNGEYDWCFTDQDYGMSSFVNRIDTLFIGRKTYEMSVAMEGGGGFPKLKEYIFSTTLDKVQTGKTLISTDIKENVQAIKNRQGKDISLFGGAGLTISLLNSGLVDELWLAVHPIMLGDGKHLFSGIKNRVHLTFVESKAYATGWFL